jgi:hypothetical protein
VEETAAAAPIRVADSITKLAPEDRGAVLIAASHGGLYPGYLAAAGGVRGVVLNDAGVGLERAGLASLDYLDALDIAAATVGHDTARIGDGGDMERRGIISHVNHAARSLGCAVGEAVRIAAEKMRAGPLPAKPAPPYEEARFLLRPPGEPLAEPPVWGLDSNSLVRPEDEGAIIVTGSHGGLLGGRPETALKYDVLGALYNDAGIGKDNAGISRLPALDGRGIAAATVAAASARIGDARSTYQDGIVSRVNARAAALGLREGMTARDFVAGLRRAIA